MAVAEPVTAHELGHAYAEAVRHEPAAEQLWVRANRGEVELRLVVNEATDADTELRLYGAGLALHDRFPDSHPFVIVINPGRYERLDPAEVIPRDAEEIPLRPA
jgi:hypothetical protein